MALIFEFDIFSTKFIYQIVEGNIPKIRNISFTLRIQDMDGILLFCVDSRKLDFSLRIMKKNNNNKLLEIHFNKLLHYVPLLRICGRYLEEERRVTFNITFLNGSIGIICNNHSQEYMSIIPKSTYKTKDVNLEFDNTSNILLMIGNIGPYTYRQNYTFIPIKNQFRGCLESFYYNNKIVKFLGKSSKISRNCKNKCYTNICNDGICNEINETESNCDCSSTWLNGPYCNKSMSFYNRTSKNSYEFNDNSSISLKMTWKQVLLKEYCLIEIIGSCGYFVIWSNSKYLFLNSTITFNNYKEKYTFINVNVTKDILTIKNLNNGIELPLKLCENVRINIGFTEKMRECEKYEGLYDIQFDISSVTQLTIEVIKKNPTKSFHYEILIVLMLVLIVFVIWSVLFYRKSLKVKQENYYEIMYASYKNDLVSLTFDSSALNSVDNTYNREPCKFKDENVFPSSPSEYQRNSPMNYTY